MKVTKTTREALKDKISHEGIHSVLRIGKRELTAKQRKFAEAVALGDTKVGAYRKAYDTKASKQQQGHQAHILSTHPKIAAQIEAFALANEAAKYRSSEGLRNLVIDSLTQIVLNPDAKDSVRVAAAKTLGTVVGVDAFVERKQITHVQDSKAIRDKILGELKTITLNLDDALDVDATALLAELAGDDDGQVADLEMQPETQEPHPTPTSQVGDFPEAPATHIIPHEPTQLLSDSQHPPMPFQSETPGGDIFLENEKG
jgi:hypothetical protein